jgi:drug/metabolite transporter (DMT)-like permease
MIKRIPIQNPEIAVMNATERVKAHLALAGTQLFFAINFSAVKILINNGLVKPFGLNLVRVLVATSMFWILWFLRPKKVLIEKQDRLRLVGASLTGITINQLLFIKGLSLTSPMHGSLLMLTTPIMITFVAAWFLKESLNSKKMTGLLLGVCGALILILNGNKSDEGADFWLGDMLILINAVSYSFYFILVSPLMSKYDSIDILRYVFSIGTLFMLPFCFSEFMEIPWKHYDYQATINLILITVGGTFCSYLFNIYGMKRLGASVAGTYIYLQPLMTAAIAMVFLNEYLNGYKLLAGILIFAGVYLGSRSIRDKG